MKKMVQNGAKRKPGAKTWTWSDPPWTDDRLELTEKREVRSTLPNVVLILREHPAWRGVLAYDEFAEATITTRPPPWHPIDAPAKIVAGEVTDTDVARLQSWLARAMYLRVDARIVEAALDVAAKSRRVHPVREALRSVKWDRRKRLDTWAIRYLGAPDTPYVRGISRKYLIGAVARIEEPGCQMDTILVLEGPQSLGKSSFLRELPHRIEWYSEAPIDIGNKDAPQNMRGIWIYSLDELDSIRRAEITRTKTFLSMRHDRYRPPYGRRAQTFARQTAFAGCTNEETYLVDATGNRRFWPIRCTRIDLAALRREKAQLWAEALYAYEQGESWWPDAELGKLCAAEQAERMTPDDWQGPVEAWCRAHDMGDGVLTIDVLTGALDFTRDRVAKAHTMRVAEVLRTLGYVRGERVREGEHVEGREGRRQVRRYVLADAKARKQQAWRYAKAQREKAQRAPRLRPPGPPGSGVITRGPRPLVSIPDRGGLSGLSKKASGKQGVRDEG